MRAAADRLETDTPIAVGSRSCAVVAILLASLLGCSRESAETAYRRVWNLYASGALLDAVQAASSECERFKKSGDAAASWKFRLIETESLLALGRAEDALALIAEPVPASLESGQLALRQMMDRADAYAKSARIPESIIIVDRIRPQAAGIELQYRLDVLRGQLLARTGKLKDAEDILSHTADAAARTGDSFAETSALSNLSSCRKVLFRYSEAIEFSLRAAGIAEKRGYRRVAGVAHLNAGSLYRIVGEFERAEWHGQKAIELLSAVNDQFNLMVAHGELGLLWATQDDFNRANESYRRAFDIAMRLKSNRDAARNADNLSEVYIELNRLDDAEYWNNQSRLLAGPDSESGPFQMVNAARIADGRGQTDAAITMLHDAANRKKVPPNVVWDCHAYLGRIFVRQHEYSEADREYRAMLDAITKASSDLLNPQFQITFLSRLIHFHQEYVDLLIDRNDDPGALRVIESSRARVLAARLGLDAMVPRAIDEGQLTQLARETNTSIISFWLAPKRSFAWLIDKTGVQRFDLPPESEIERLVTAYREIVEHPLRDPILTSDPNGPKLWNALLGQIAPHIPKGSRVVVIPDGPLHRLNLETLPVPGPQPHYWIEDVELAVAPSLAIAASKPPAGSTDGRIKSLLLIGAPAYGSDYVALPKAETEISEISARFPNAAKTVEVGRNATPAAYSNSKPEQFSLIHFAAHAESNNASPLESAVVLSHAGDSYKLYARDVINVHINADLVTISACQSAGVRAYAGEGLIGFAWAFLQAGARGVVAGLWDVSDTSTEPLMNEFYGRLASGSDAVTAMREAKLTLLKQPRYGKPFYWAPFQVYVRSVRK